MTTPYVPGESEPHAVLPNFRDQLLMGRVQGIINRLPDSVQLGDSERGLILEKDTTGATIEMTAPIWYMFSPKLSQETFIADVTYGEFEGGIISIYAKLLIQDDDEKEDLPEPQVYTYYTFSEDNTLKRRGVKQYFKIARRIIKNTGIVSGDRRAGDYKDYNDLQYGK